MEKMIVTEYSKPIPMSKVKEFVRRAIPLEDEKVIPYALFALLDNGEMVNIGNFYDIDVVEIIEILLDIFKDDGKHIFNVNLEMHGITEVLTLLQYATGSLYHAAVEDLKISLANGDIDVSFS